MAHYRHLRCLPRHLDGQAAMYMKNVLRKGPTWDHQHRIGFRLLVTNSIAVSVVPVSIDIDLSRTHFSKDFLLSKREDSFEVPPPRLLGRQINYCKRHV